MLPNTDAWTAEGENSIPEWQDINNQTRRASRNLKAFDMIAGGHDMFVKCLPDKEPFVQIRDM